MKGLLPALFASAALAISAHAQNATTTPVGAMTYSFPALVGAVKTTTMSVPLYPTPIFTGRVGSMSSNTITVAGAGWTPGALATAAQPYFVRFTSGSQAGRTIKVNSNTSDTLTLDTTDNTTQTTPLDLAGWSVGAGISGDTFEVMPGYTLALLFGDNTAGNLVEFKKATSIKGADTVQLYNGSAWDIYYFDLTPGLNCWRLKTNSINANNKVIYPGMGIMVSRRPYVLPEAQTVEITVTGNVPTIAPLTKTIGSVSTSYVGSGFPVDTTLGDLGLSGWTKESFKNADKVLIYNGSGWNIYYQSLANSNWYEKNNPITNAANVSIPAGSIIGITKRLPVSGAASFLKSASMPYSL